MYYNFLSAKTDGVDLSNTLPKKLKHDGIIEAVFEIQFDPDSTTVPEILFGRLADTTVWRNLKQKRLPAADIPAAIRRADVNFRYQASIELFHPDGGISVRMGPQSLAYSRRAPYPGWEKFGAEILESIDALYRVTSTISATRLGLRYINALRSDVHGIGGVGDLDLKIAVSNERLTKNLNLNYRVPISEDSSCMVRVATPDFAQGNIPENSTVLVDVDVSTNAPYSANGVTTVKGWIGLAHEAEKRNFFSLLTEETITNLKED